MVMIVGESSVSVERLSHRSTLPSVEALRPTCCPYCGHVAQQPSKLGVVGHGTYTRQVLGLIGRSRQLMIWVRRYLCRGCQKTISVLPDALCPGRWYARIAIFASLFLGLLCGWRPVEIQQLVGSAGSSAGWRTPRRWRRRLLGPMQSWLVGQLSCDALDHGEQDRRLRQVLALHGVGPPIELADLRAAAIALINTKTE